jgi:hypothetical protein
MESRSATRAFSAILSCSACSMDNTSVWSTPPRAQMTDCHCLPSSRRWREVCIGPLPSPTLLPTAGAVPLGTTVTAIAIPVVYDGPFSTGDGLRSILHTDLRAHTDDQPIVIRYTTDGTQPLVTSSILTSISLPDLQSTTVTAQAFQTGRISAAPTTAQYTTMGASVVSISPSSGLFTDSTSVGNSLCSSC